MNEECGSQLSQWIPSALVILGWIIVNHQNNFRETRKEKRSQLSAVAEKLIALQENAIKFHCSESHDKILAFSIKNEIQEVIAETLSLELLTPAKIRLLKKLRQAITLKNFDEPDWKKQGLESEVIQNICQVKLDIKNALERHFNSTYWTPAHEKLAILIATNILRLKKTIAEKISTSWNSFNKK